MIYDDWCYKQRCEHYIDWQFSDDGYDQPYDCTSCKLQGQSYNITEIAKDCPYKDRAIVQQQVQPDNGGMCTRPDVFDCHAKVGTGGRCMNIVPCPPLQVN